MNSFRIAMTGMLLVSMTGCHKSKDKDPVPPSPGPVVNPQPKPIVTLGLQGGLTVGSVLWTLPKYLEGQFKNLDHDQAEAALDIELVKGEAKKTVHVNSGFQVKSCKPAEEAEAFAKGLAVDPADSLAEALKTDLFEISNWTAESKTFKGRILLQKRYRSEGDTGIYRLDALVANEKAADCVLWNFVFTPPAGTSADFIEGSDGYKELVESITATWDDLGAEFEE